MRDWNICVTNVFFSISGVVGATNMNAHSSRSHAIFTVTIECSDKGPDGKQRVRVGKLHLVDLAVRFLHVLVMNLVLILRLVSKLSETLNL